MLKSAKYRELRNRKRYNRGIERALNENGGIEENETGNSSQNVEGEVSGIRRLTQKAVNEQIQGFVAPLFRHLEEMIRLVQVLVTTSHPCL